jgi:hypothetical protein
MITDQQLQNWSRALSETENAKCVSTVSLIKKTLQERFGDSVNIFLQGSYKNSTNVRQDSDVDIVVCYNQAYFFDDSALSEHDKNHHTSLKDGDYSFSQFKIDVERALKNKFLNSAERDNKCIFVKGNSYRVKADVVPCFVFNRFNKEYRVEAKGIKLISDKGESIASFPDQHYENGCAKNDITNRNYKAVVRVLKNVRNDLVDNGKIDEKLMSSFFLECLVWNVLHHHFYSQLNKDSINNIIQVLWSDMCDIERADNYAEVSDLMWLFKGQTQRTPEKAKTFLAEAYNLIN